MLKRILLSINELGKKLIVSLKRFPQALTLAFTVVMVLIYLNHAELEHASKEIVTRIAMVLALGIPLSLCIKMIFERLSLKRSRMILMYIGAAIALVVYYFFFLPDTNMVSMTRYIAYSLALYLIFSFIPYLRHKDGYELYVIKLFTSFIVTYSYSLVLYAGMAAILFTINTLFSAGISSRVYFDLWLIVVGVFAPSYYLADIPAYGVVHNEEEYPGFLRILLTYIVLPLLTAYTVILYAYFIKILVTWHWPAGIVSNLVLWYSIISTVVLFFIFILKKRNSWISVFIKYFPKLILPLMVMMFIAMGIRINAYGITENRYLVLTGGIWTACSMLYFAIKKNPKNIYIVLSVSVIAVFVVSGPWSCYSIAKYSQNNRLEKIVTRNNMIQNGNIVPSKDISKQDKKDIISIVRYFERNHSLRDIKILPPDFKKDDMKNVFGFEMSIRDREYFHHNLSDMGRFQDIKGYDYFVYLPPQKSDLSSIEEGDLSISYDSNSKVITILQQGAVIYKKGLSEAAISIHVNNDGKKVVQSKDMIFIDENENMKIMILFRNINGFEDEGDGQSTIEWLDFSLFIKAI